MKQSSFKSRTYLYHNLKGNETKPTKNHIVRHKHTSAKLNTTTVETVSEIEKVGQQYSCKSRIY